MKYRGLMLAFGLLALAPLPVQAQGQRPAMPADTQLQGVSRETAQDLIGKLEAAQAALRQGRALTFALLAGAPASYEQAKVAPRDAFLGLSFTRPFAIRAQEDRAGRKVYQVELLPNGPGQIVCDVEVVLGFGGQIERIEIFYRPPAPF